jgi:hypothetical protein
MSTNQANSPFQQLLDQQSQLMDNWMEFSKKVGENLVNPGPSANGTEASSSAAPTQVFESWFKQQQDMANNFFGAYRTKPTNSLFMFTPEQLKGQFDMYMNWFQQYQKMMKDAGIESPIMSFSEQVGQIGQQIDQFSRLFSELAKSWEPFTRLVQQGANVEQIMSEWMKPEAYKQMFDNMMGAMNMETAWEKASEMQTRFVQFMDQMQQGNFERLSVTVGMKPWFDMMHKMNDQVPQNLAPFSQSLTRSRESEIFRLMQEVGLGMSDYNLKMTELQANYYQTSYDALGKTVQEEVAKFQKDPTSLNYETFFKGYLDQLESTLTAAFETAEYGKLQNAVAKTGAELKNKMENITELMFAGTPFMVRSQGEDLAGEIQSLKRKVRSLESQLKAAKAPAKPVAKTTKPKSSSTKK